MNGTMVGYSSTNVEADRVPHGVFGLRVLHGDERLLGAHERGQQVVLPSPRDGSRENAAVASAPGGVGPGLCLVHHIGVILTTVDE